MGRNVEPVNGTPLSAASASRPECASCGLYRRCERPFARPHVPVGWSRKLLLVSDRSEIEWLPFVAAALQKEGLQLRDIAVVSAVRCATEAAPSMAQIRACRPFLVRALSALRAKRVVALGAVALKAVLNSGASRFLSVRGRTIASPEGVRFEVTYHPRDALADAAHLKRQIVSDLRLRPVLQPPVTVPLDSVELRQIAIDSEWDSEGRFLLAAFSDGQRTATVEADGIGAVKTELTDVRGHHVWVDIEMLARCGIGFADSVFEGVTAYDSALLMRAADETLDSFALEDAVSRQFDVGRGWKWKTERELARLQDAGQLDRDLLRERCVWDAHATWHLTETLLPKVRLELIEYIGKLAAVLRRVGLAGIPVDLQQFERLRTEWDREKAEAEARIRAVGFDGRLSNAGDVARFLYSTLKLPAIKRTATGKAAVDKTTLRELLRTAESDAQKAALSAYLDWAKRAKLLSTWSPVVDTITHRKGNVGLFHAWIHPVGTRTGRRSSGASEENLSARNAQNWPPQAKAAFVGVVAADFDRLEPILMAHHARDRRLLELFCDSERNGYCEIAELLWRKKVEEGTGPYKAAKAIVLGVHYDMGPSKMAQQLWAADLRFSSDYKEHARVTARVHRRYLTLFEGVAQYIEDRKREVRRTQKVVARDGWVRHLPYNEQTLWRAENQAVNFPIQHAASVVTGAALIEFERAQLSRAGWSAKDLHLALLEDPWSVPFGVAVNEVHDELMIRPVIADDVEVLVSCMRSPTLARTLLRLPELQLNVKVTQFGRLAR